MADRYAVANGNWSSTSTWSLTQGGAPGASKPSAGLVADVSNRLVTVDEDVTCERIEGGAASEPMLAIPVGNRTITANIQFSSPFAIILESGQNLTVTGDLLAELSLSSQMIQLGGGEGGAGSLTWNGNWFNGYCVLNYGGAVTLNGNIYLEDISADIDVYEQGEDSTFVMTGDINTVGEGHPLRIHGGTASITGDASIGGGEACDIRGSASVTWDGTITLERIGTQSATGFVGDGTGTLELNGGIVAVKGDPGLDSLDTVTGDYTVTRYAVAMSNGSGTAVGARV